MIFTKTESTIIITNIQIDKKYEKFNAFERFKKTTRWLIKKNRSCLQIFINNADIACLKERNDVTIVFRICLKSV